MPGCCVGAISASRQLPAQGQSCACLRHGDEELGVRPSLLRVSGGHGLLGWGNGLGQLLCSALCWGCRAGLSSGRSLHFLEQMLSFLEAELIILEQIASNLRLIEHNK